MAHHHDHDRPAHSHGHHGHDHAPGRFDRAFAIGTVLNLGFVAALLAFGLLANSLALLADAAHNFSDVIGLLLAWGASWLSRRRPTARRTYGFRRASILTALANAALLFVATGGIILEATQRFAAPEPVAESTVLWVAALGIAINTATALLLLRGRHGDLNVRGAFLHMAGDAAVSLGVVVAALLIGWTGLLWLDPAVSLGIAAVILLTSWGLARSALDLALDAVPEGIEREKVEAYLRELPGVASVHDLHIWGMSTTETALTAHLVRPGENLDDQLLAEAADTLRHRFGIGHATLQVESGNGDPCRLAADACGQGAESADRAAA